MTATRPSPKAGIHILRSNGIAELHQANDPRGRQDDTTQGTKSREALSEQTLIRSSRQILHQNGCCTSSNLHSPQGCLNRFDAHTLLSQGGGAGINNPGTDKGQCRDGSTSTTKPSRNHLTTSQAAKQSSNQATKQPSNQAAKQPSSQAAKARTCSKNSLVCLMTCVSTSTARVARLSDSRSRISPSLTPYSAARAFTAASVRRNSGFHTLQWSVASQQQTTTTNDNVSTASECSQQQQQPTRQTVPTPAPPQTFVPCPQLQWRGAPTPSGP